LQGDDRDISPAIKHEIQNLNRCTPSLGL
jgi:hypothetical protein